jgi:hypothetical protein
MDAKSAKFFTLKDTDKSFLLASLAAKNIIQRLPDIDMDTGKIAFKTWSTQEYRTSQDCTSATVMPAGQAVPYSPVSENFTLRPADGWILRDFMLDDMKSTPRVTALE